VHLERNPIFFRVMSNRRWPSVHTSFYLAFALGLVSLIAGSALTLIAGNLRQTETIMELLMGAVVVLNVITTFVTAVVAAILAVDTQQDQMIELTTLAPKVRANGSIAAALYRVRVLLIVIIGLLPAAVIGWTYMSGRVDVTFRQIITCLDSEYCNYPPPSNISSAGLGFLWLALNLLLLIGLAAVMGVTVGHELKRRARITASLFSLVLVLISLVLWCAVEYLLIASGWIIYLVPPLLLIGAIAGLSFLAQRRI
jgi:hypothetical protein